MKFIRKILRRHSAAQPAFQRFLELKDSALGQTCFLIGNGPSLTMADLEDIRGTPSFASNKIFLAFPNTSWRPTFYAATDLPCIAEAQERMLPASETQCFFPTYAPRHRKLKAWYFDLLVQSGETPDFKTNLENGVGSGATVSFFHLQLAYHMGFERVCLIGCDCNYQVSDAEADNDGYVQNTASGNYFVEHYHSRGERIAKVNVDGQIACFESAKNAFESDGRSIINATRGGNLNVFPRLSLESILAAVK